MWKLSQQSLTLQPAVTNNIARKCNTPLPHKPYHLGINPIVAGSNNNNNNNNKGIGFSVCGRTEPGPLCGYPDVLQTVACVEERIVILKAMCQVLSKRSDFTTLVFCCSQYDSESCV